MTKYDANAVQVEILRRMSQVERLKAAERLYWSARRLKAAHLRALHPDWTAERVDNVVKEAFTYVRG